MYFPRFMKVFDCLYWCHKRQYLFMIFIESSILTQLLTLCKRMIELQFYSVYFIVQEIAIVFKASLHKRSTNFGCKSWKTTQKTWQWTDNRLRQIKFFLGELAKVIKKSEQKNKPLHQILQFLLFSWLHYTISYWMLQIYQKEYQLLFTLENKESNNLPILLPISTYFKKVTL